MSSFGRSLLFVVLFVLVALAILTWGSVGSAVLTMALLIGLGYYLLRRHFDTHDPDDYRME